MLKRSVVILLMGALLIVLGCATTGSRQRPMYWGPEKSYPSTLR